MISLSFAALASTNHPGDNREHEAYRSAMVTLASDGVALFDPHDPALPWRTIDCNEAFCKLAGCSRQELLSQSMADFALAGPTLNAAYLTRLRSSGRDLVEIAQIGADGLLVVVEAALSVISIGGREYVLRADRAITERKQAEQELRRRTAIDRCATAVARRLSQVPASRIDGAIGEALAEVGAFLAVDRVSLFRLSADMTLLHVRQEWARLGVPALRASMDTTSLATLPILLERLRGQRIAYINDLVGLAPAAVGERAWLAARGTRAAIAVPFGGAEQRVGVLSCELIGERRVWTSEDVALLLMVGEALSRAIEHEQIETSRVASDIHYQMLADHATDIISLHTTDGVFRYCSPAARAILGYSPEALLGRSPVELIHPDDLGVALGRGKVHESGAITTSFRVRHQEGHYLWIETSVRAVCDATSGVVREIVAITRDINERKRFEEQIEHLAYFDPLTRLANRLNFHEQAHAAMEQAARTGGRLALLYLDLDGFKKVNDTLGHGAGDELLVQVSARLRAQLREGDLLGRLGGDEFAVLLPMVTAETDAARLAQDLADAIRRPLTIRGQMLYLGVSIGIALSQDGLSFEELLRHADIAMYRAKGGHGAVQFFDPGLSKFSRERLQLEADLRQALLSGELCAYYQPIRDLRCDRIVGVEALTRWPHPQRGLLLPSAFVPLAEECGLISELDRWMFQSAVGQLARWVAEGRKIYVTVNFSVRTLHDCGLTEFARACIKAAGVPAERLVIEVTESAAMRDPELTRLVLEDLRSLGMRVALDDFGVGHTALSYVKRLPIDYVKIDRSFIESVASDPRDAGVVRAILALSEGLGVEVVAEGVNSATQIEWLRQAGGHLVQGFGIARPQPPECIVWT
jgi:diguanylate cyclase (GGDEF)-like protein/PAS domain S-box-containing protein